MNPKLLNIITTIIVRRVTFHYSLITLVLISNNLKLMEAGFLQTNGGPSDSQDRTTDRFLYVAGQSHRSRSVSVSLDRATDRYLNVTGQSDRSRSVSVSVNRSLGLSLQPYAYRIPYI